MTGSAINLVLAPLLSCNVMEFVSWDSTLLSYIQGYSNSRIMYKAACLANPALQLYPKIQQAQHASSIAIEPLLTKVHRVLSLYSLNNINSYRMNDKIRVTLLAWELVLRNLNAIVQPIVKDWNKNLLFEIRLVYVRYHSNISYATTIINWSTLFQPDHSVAIQLGTPPFDQPPDSSQLGSHLHSPKLFKFLLFFQLFNVCVVIYYWTFIFSSRIFLSCSSITYTS